MLVSPLERHYAEQTRIPRSHDDSELISELVRELATVLLPRGVTPRQFADLTKRAFVQAAADTARFGNGKVNHSRVAVLTGLTRLEVKELLQNPPITAATARYPSRIERVIGGWRTDGRFAGRRGPKPLTIRGPRAAFNQLVKAYAGDVPPRAVLDELRRIGAVEDRNNEIKLKRGRIDERQSSTAILRAAVPALLDVLRSVSASSPAKAFPFMQRLTLRADDSVDLTMLRDRCTSAASTMLRGLGESLGFKRSAGASRPSDTNCCTTTVFVVEERISEERTIDASHRRRYMAELKPTRVSLIQRKKRIK